jgi:uncharacterized membrane protein (UPF0127 family)
MKFAVGLLALAAGVGGAGWAGYNWYASPSADASATAPKMIALTVASSNGVHAFQVEVAKSAAEQEKGLMFRTDIADNGGMLFWPYPAGGGAPKEASFWMKNTPSPLDIIFIRANGTIARIAENAIPGDETPITSGEPVGAVLELRGGRSSALGIAEGDKVTWTGK